MQHHVTLAAEQGRTGHWRDLRSMWLRRLQGLRQQLLLAERLLPLRLRRSAPMVRRHHGAPACPRSRGGHNRVGQQPFQAHRKARHRCAADPAMLLLDV